MRQIFLDTETTGLVHQQGHRIIEIAAVEAINRRLTKNHFHVYLNPEREIDQGAQEIHGITTEFLQDKPRFVDIVDDFLQFIAGADLIIHNARFDVEFLNAELGRIDKPEIEKVCNSIIDTLQMAKDSRPGQRNSLDALCRHYGIDNSKRVLHGALLDAELLAEVYMAMTRGQESLMMDLLDHGVEVEDSGVAVSSKSLPVIRATSEELAMHDAYLAALEKSGNCLWPK
jgi:DNA polymerase-3 subunit epsilon